MRSGSAWALVAVLAVAGGARCTCAPTAEPAPADGAATPAPELVADARPERIVLTGIAVKTIDPDVSRELYPRQLAQRLGMTLTGSSLFDPRPELVPATHRARTAGLDLRVQYDVIEAGSLGLPAIVVAVEGAFAWEEAAAVDPAPWASLVVETPVPEAGDAMSNLDGLTAEAVAQATAELGRHLIARERLRVAGEQSLNDVLADPESQPEMVLWALALVSHRRAPLVDAVLPWLEAEEGAVRVAAVRTLVTLSTGADGARDRQRVVEAIARHARFDDDELLTAVIDAMVELGGDEARAFLEFAASGHPDETMRARAAEAAAELAPP